VSTSAIHYLVEAVERKSVLTPPHPGFQVGNCYALACPALTAVAEQLQLILAPSLPQDGTVSAAAIAANAADALAIERL
jgi:hypothetical protein